MSAGQKRWTVRVLAGGLVGAGLAGAGYRPLFIGGFSAPPLCGALVQSCGAAGAAAVTLVLFFAFGAAVGVATLPFEDEWDGVLRRSLLHFAVTAGIFAAILRVCFGVAWGYLPGWLALLGAVYLVVWLGRWVGWYAEVRQLRSALGLEAGSSPLRWRESLPYLPVLVLVDAVLPVVLTLLDAADVPVLRALVVPYLLLPVGGFFPAFSLGKRQGVCPLYPLSGALLFLGVSLWAYRGQAVPFFWGLAFVSPLAGNLSGACWRRWRGRRT